MQIPPTPNLPGSTCLRVKRITGGLSPPAGTINQQLYAYCPIELATDEKTLFELPPMSRIVPTTRTRITASITAYSAMSWPSCSDQSLFINLAILPSSWCCRAIYHAVTERACQIKVVIKLCIYECPVRVCPASHLE
jgi:hypothetical protein